MKRVDDFKKLPSDDEAGTLSILFGSAIVLFRMKTLINLILHLLFAALYAFEHNNQVTLYSEALQHSTTDETTLAIVDVVYTPAGNIIVMVL